LFQYETVDMQYFLSSAGTSGTSNLIPLIFMRILNLFLFAYLELKIDSKKSFVIT
jgi:hypothetical protein